MREKILVPFEFGGYMPYGEVHMVTLPFCGSYGEPREGYKMGAMTPSLVGPSESGHPYWELWMQDDKGVYWPMTTHVQNEMLDRRPWVEQMLIELGILNTVETDQ